MRRSNHVKRPVNFVQRDLRDRADGGRLVKHIRKRTLKRGDRLGGRIHGQRGFLPHVKRANVVESQDVIGVAMREENRVQAFQAHAERLRAEVRRRVDHRGLPLMNQEHGRAQAIVPRVLGTAHAAMASERRDSHGCAGAKHGEFEYGIGMVAGRADPQLRPGFGLVLATRRLRRPWSFP